MYDTMTWTSMHMIPILIHRRFRFWCLFKKWNIPMCVSPSYFTELLFKYSWNRTGRWFHMIIFNPVDHRQRWMHPFFIKQTKFIKNIFGQFWNIFRLPVYTSWSISDTLFVWNVYTTTSNSISYFCTELRLFKYSNTLQIESKKEGSVKLK